MGGRNRNSMYRPLPVVGVVLLACGGCGDAAAVAPRPPSSASSESNAPGPPPAVRAEVKIEQFAYEPRSLRVAPGTTVVWTNRDDAPHTVTDENRQFESPPLDSDGGYEHRFDRPGTYRYFCALHPHMTGQITVELETAPRQ